METRECLFFRGPLVEKEGGTSGRRPLPAPLLPPSFLVLVEEGQHPDVMVSGRTQLDYRECATASGKEGGGWTLYSANTPFLFFVWTSEGG